MTLEDHFRLLVGGYFGVREMDDYNLKIYILQDIEQYIRAFLKENKLENFDFQKEIDKIESNLSIKQKLQDALLVLRKIEGPLDLELMIKARLKEMQKMN